MARKNERPDPLEALLVELDLTALAKRLPDLLAAAEKSRPSYSEFVREALEVEQAARWERKVARRVRWSRLGAPVDLDGFDWSARPQLTPSAVKELLTCRFVSEKRNLILVGRSSLGKSTIAKALGRAACERGMSVLYVSLSEMLEALGSSRADGTYRKGLRRVVQPDLLILEDCGLDVGLPAAAANELFRVVCARYQQRSTVIVTNVPFRRWGEFLPNSAQAVAIADRLVHDATILRFTGKPFRQPREVLGAPLDDE